MVEDIVSTDAKSAKILAGTFFQELRANGYTPNQIIGVATELIDLVTTEVKVKAAADRAAELAPATTPMPMPKVHAQPQ